MVWVACALIIILILDFIAATNVGINHHREKTEPKSVRCYEAKFIGTDGSMGFRTGETYVIELTSWHDEGLQVHSLTNNVYCPYDTVNAFLANWKLLRCEND